MDENQKIAELQQKIKELELQLKKAKESTGYGLKREDKPEIFDEKAQNALPVLKENKDLFIDNKSDLDHIIIEGDNYHALSALNYTHKGKIDMIYIDPPYNTGNKDFIYNDHYLDKEDAYKHSKRLSFMSKRLRLAKNLLSEKGSIFISIDDNEEAQVKLLCDEIFGEKNLLKILVWESGKPFGFKATKTTRPRIHEYILHYAKNIDNVGYNPTFTETISSTGEKVLTGSLIKVETDKIYSMDFIQGAKESVVKYGLQSFGSGQKPIKLIQKFILAGGNRNSIILDFFAGSGTTGHAVLDLNKQDGGHRQFILCSNRENTKENPDKNICRDITYERNKRVMQGYTNAKGEKVEGLGGGNLRYYTTDFIKNKKSTDDLRQSFIYLCDELLCIKEDTFNEVKSEFCSNKLKCYQKNNHYTAILYDVREMDKLKELLGSIEGQISVYLFSLSGDSCEEELQEFSNRITIENIPDDILETYKKIF